MKTAQQPGAVVLLSGGMDSCITAALAVRKQPTAALHVSYGQRTEAREAQAFDAICSRLGLAPRLRLQHPLFTAIGGSALTDPAVAVPDAGEHIGRGPVPVTYVPFRNAHLLAAAVSWAETLGAKKVYIGAVEQDGSGYPDTRPAFLRAFAEAVRTGTAAGDIDIAAPLLSLSKAEIVRLGLELGAPLDLTWSCYSHQDQACGTCESCVLRLRAFAGAGARDPLPYAAQPASA
jgi:7-cyano-7-deazaguanine synthase